MRNFGQLFHSLRSGRAFRLRAAAIAATLLVSLVVVPAIPVLAVGVDVQLVSSSMTGGSADSRSLRGSVSADGRYVVFESRANNLVADDSDGMDDIFLSDQLTGVITQISDSQANTHSNFPKMTPDQRYIVFETNANLDGANPNNVTVIYLRDMVLGTVERIDHGTGLSSSFRPAITPDGRYVTYWSNADGQLYRKDRVTGEIDMVSVSTSGSQGVSPCADMYWAPSISPDGRFIAFHTCQDNLVTGDTNNRVDVFLRDMELKTTVRVSVSRTGEQANDRSDGPSVSVSSNGRWVLFESRATNLIFGVSGPVVYLKDIQTGAIERISTEGNTSYNSYMTANGRFVIYEVAGKGFYLRDRIAGTATKVASADWTSSQSPTFVTEDGRHAIVTTAAALLITDTNVIHDIYHLTIPINPERVTLSTSGGDTNGTSTLPTVSADGRYVVFNSVASNLVLGDTNGTWDVFLRDRATGVTTRLSVDQNGVESPRASTYPRMTPDARYVVFESSGNLDGTNPTPRQVIYLRDLQLGTISRVDHTMNYQEFSAMPSISADGHYVSYWANVDQTVQLYRKDLVNGQLEVVTVSPTGELGSCGGCNSSYRTANMSPDGRFIVFQSGYNNLVADDTNGFTDVFVRDMLLGSTMRVNVSSTGVQADKDSINASGFVTSDGRYVVFESEATTLVSGSSGRVVYLKDMLSGSIERISTQGSTSVNSYMTPDGRYIAFEVAGQGLYIRDRSRGTVTKIAATGWYPPESPTYVTADGQFVAFSTDGNLNPGDTNAKLDIYVFTNSVQ